MPQNKPLKAAPRKPVKWPEMSKDQRREEMAKYTWHRGAKVVKR